MAPAVERISGLSNERTGRVLFRVPHTREEAIFERGFPLTVVYLHACLAARLKCPERPPPNVALQTKGRSVG